MHDLQRLQSERFTALRSLMKICFDRGQSIRRLLKTGSLGISVHNSGVIAAIKKDGKSLILLKGI
jgi:hypothetical protein